MYSAYYASVLDQYRMAHQGANPVPFESDLLYSQAQLDVLNRVLSSSSATNQNPTARTGPGPWQTLLETFHTTEEEGRFIHDEIAAFKVVNHAVRSVRNFIMLQYGTNTLNLNAYLALNTLHRLQLVHLLGTLSEALNRFAPTVIGLRRAFVLSSCAIGFKRAGLPFSRFLAVTASLREEVEAQIRVWETPELVSVKTMIRGGLVPVPSQRRLYLSYEAVLVDYVSFINHVRGEVRF